MSRGYSNDPFEEMLTNQARIEDDEKRVKNSPKPQPRSTSYRGDYTRGNKRKPIIILIAFAILMSFAIGMTIIDKKYTETHSANAVQMQTIKALFLDMNGDGQIDAAQLDINNDGVIDAILQGSFLPVTQMQMEVTTPMPNPPQPPPEE